CEQLTKGHMRLAVHAKIVEETGHTIFEPELRLAHQHHHRDCSSQRLRQRREVEHGFQPHRQRLWLERAATEGALESDVVALSYGEYGTWNRLPLDCFGQCSLDFTPSHFSPPTLSVDTGARGTKCKVSWHPSPDCHYFPHHLWPQR